MNATLCYGWVITTAIALLIPMKAIAQVTPDRSLGIEQSTVNRNVSIKDRNGDRIEGGARRGANLFHSFEQFNVDEGQRVYFANPDGVRNILSRVTGGDRSSILGTLGVDGTANLFLLNSNGIFFGENASLDIRGSFVASTANRIQFGSQGFFSAEDPQSPALLTVQPSALVLSRAAGAIQVESRGDAGGDLAGNPLLGLRVANGQNLLLVGGDLAIAGGLHALGGNLELVATRAPATIELGRSSPSIQPTMQPTMQPMQPISTPANRGNVLIHQGAFLNVRADNGGAIQIYARDISIRENSLLSAGIARGFGTQSSQAGDITLNATGKIDVIASAVNNVLRGQGAGGNLFVRGQSLRLEDGSFFDVSTRSQGNAGRVVIQVMGPVILTEGSTIFNTLTPMIPATSSQIGATGGIFLEAGSLTMLEASELVANTSGTGNVGDIVVRVRGDVRFDGSDVEGNPSGIFNVVRPDAVGNAGDIRLSARSLSLTNGAQLQTNTSSQGNAGNVWLQVRDRFLMDSLSAGIQALTGIFTAVATDGVGAGGDINIQAGSIVIRNGAQLTANTFERGNAGNITIQARTVTLDGSNENYQTEADRKERVRSGIFSAVGEDFTDRTIPAFGDGGDIRITANRVVVRHGAAIGTSVTSNSRGNAGSITINARDRILVRGRSRQGDASDIAAQVSPGAVGNAGAIRLNSDRLTISDGAALRTNMGGIGSASNIQINALVLEILQGGQMLTTTAGSSRAGDIDLTVGDRIVLSGRRSGLFANTVAGSTGQGGSIRLRTDHLLVQDRARVSAAATTPTSRAGDIVVNAEQVELARSGRLSVAAQSGGIAGDLRINARRLTVSNQSEVTVSSPQGRAGNLTITANQIDLNRGRLTAEAGAGSGAEVNLQGLDQLLLQNNSLISAQAFANATGGNVTVDTSNGFVVATPEQNSDILAIASQGRGGNISITTQGIYGIDPQRATPRNQTNDIDASSRFSQPGTVTITRPDVDPTQGVTELPSEPRSQPPLASCQPGGGSRDRFIATGSGGLPTQPDEPLSSLETLDDLTLPEQWRNRLVPAEVPHRSRQIITSEEQPNLEAQRWIINSRGEVELISGQNPDLQCSLEITN